MCVCKRGLLAVLCAIVCQSVQVTSVEAELLVKDVSPGQLCALATKQMFRPATIIGACSVTAYFVEDLQKQQPDFFPEEVIGQCKDTMADCLKKFSMADSRCDFEGKQEALKQCTAPVSLVRQCVNAHATLLARLGRVLKCGATFNAEQEKKLAHKIERLKQKLASCEMLEKLCPEFKSDD